MFDRTLKCDYCGRFISYKDLERGKARRTLLSDDTEFSGEDWENQCKKCVKEEKMFAAQYNYSQGLPL